MEVIKMKFKDDPIGARFKYPENEKIWVKLNSYPDSDGLICSWDGNVKGFQSLCSFSDKDEGINFETEIELI